MKILLKKFFTEEHLAGLSPTEVDRYKEDIIELNSKDFYSNTTKENFRFPFVDLQHDPNDEFLITIDNGTVSMGITVASMNTKTKRLSLGGMDNKELYGPTPVYIISLKRDNNYENDPSEFYDTALRFIDDIMVCCKVKCIAIEGVFVKFKNASQTLKAGMDRVKALANRNNVEYRVIMPQTWKSFFLKPIKEEFNLNLSKSNKEIIPIRCRQIYGYLITDRMPQDVYDSLGIFEYLASLHSIENLNNNNNQVIQVNKSMTKTKKKVNIDMILVEDLNDMEKCKADIVALVTSKNLKEGDITAFDFCHDMTVDENAKVVKNLNYGLTYVAFCTMSHNVLIEAMKKRLNHTLTVNSVYIVVIT